MKVARRVNQKRPSQKPGRAFQHRLENTRKDAFRTTVQNAVRVVNTGDVEDTQALRRLLGLILDVLSVAQVIFLAAHIAVMNEYVIAAVLRPDKAGSLAPGQLWLKGYCSPVKLL